MIVPAQGAIVELHGVPVQLLGPDALAEDGIRTAILHQLGSQKIPILPPEHLAALALDLGRAKDWRRLLDFLEWPGFDHDRFHHLVAQQARDALGYDPPVLATATAPREPVIRERSEHPISRRDIDPNALKVLYRLHQAGFLAYMVGGSVRDLMLGRTPKDYDVGTNARPNEVRRVFRNSRIIGRRFRLVHVLFSGDVVEVSTFRREPDPDEQDRDEGELLVTSDNTFGTPEQDAFRRDFTINALFYDISDFSVVDYTGGLDDLDSKIVRVIGDPDVRFLEDPVRMMRACEFAGRLGFGIDPATQEAIGRHRLELSKASPARLTEELLSLLRCRRSGASAQWMLELGLLDVLVPEIHAMLAGRVDSDFSRLLPAIDRAVAGGDELSDATLLAAILVPQIYARRDQRERRIGRPLSRGEVRAIVIEETAPFALRFALSKARSERMIDALVTFQRMCEPDLPAKVRLRSVRHPSFADALALVQILVDATGEGQELLDLWRETEQNARQLGARDDSDEPSSAPGRRRRRRRRR